MYETHRRNIWPRTLVFEDLDGNGLLDLLVANEYASTSTMEPLEWVDTIGGPADYVGAFDTIVFTNGGASLQESLLPYQNITPHHARGHSFSIADVDADGQVELALPIMRDDGSQVFDLFVGKPADFAHGHGLTVRFSGKPAVPGTRAVLTCGCRSQARTLYASEGSGAAARQELHFGCGAATSFDSLQVTVPGGDAIDVPSGPLDRAITLPL
jgi:hypothetical protein